MSGQRGKPLSGRMEGTLQAMRAGTRYEDGGYGVMKFNASVNAPNPSVSTMDALERRGLVRCLTPRLHGGSRVRWELTEEGRRP